MISLKLIAILIIAVIIIYLASLSFMTRQHPIKAEGQRLLEPCPDTTANCVSSESSEPRHAIRAFNLLNGNRETSWNKFTDAISRSGGEILVNDGQYCHAVFTSTIFRFKDDVEALLKQDEIAVRSASRAGRSDLGQNRKRIEKIRSIYH